MADRKAETAASKFDATVTSADCMDRRSLTATTAGRFLPISI